MDQLWFLLTLVIAATSFGIYRKWSDGRTRIDSHVAKLSITDLGVELGEKATLVQFSSAFCAPCRTTKLLLTKLVESVPGVQHVELDAESNLELVRKLDISRTPTTLILDSSGSVRNRVVGVPKQAELLSVLANSI